MSADLEPERDPHLALHNETSNELGRYYFKVLPLEADFRRKLTMSTLLIYLLNSADFHAKFLGYDLGSVQKLGYSWVIVRVVVELKRFPRLDEKICIETWVEGMVKAFFKRNYCITGEDGEVIGYARTIWTVIDSKERKAINISEFLSRQHFLDRECPIASCRSIPPLCDDDSTIDSFLIRYSDIDPNQHLSSWKYVEHVMDAFTLHKYERRDVTRFEMEFMREGLFGERISVKKKETEENLFTIELRNEDNTTLCRSRVRFSDKLFVEQYLASKNS